MMTSAKTLALTMALMAAAADAHSKMALPKPTWDPAWGTNSPSGTIDGPSVLTPPSGMSFSTDPASNTKAYTAAFKAQTKYTSMKQMVDATQKLESGASKECGFSLVNGAAQPLPDQVEWDQLPASHEGPCEVWCDDKLAFSDENCAINYPDSPAKLPYDKSKCTGAKMLTSVWLALHVPTWQVYYNCAPLSGASSSGSSASSTSTATTTAPAASAADDEYASTASSATADESASSAAADESASAAASVGADEFASTAASASDETSAPAASSAASATADETPAPAATTSKCKAKTTRRRRN
uniref:SCP domain-containing protein n=1 Tax=Globisporangium ultimum (strain ATCC 200006 / CBS 805.95 / DAOM BR144) TaxID=431595 RepID=K3W983_GLOUD